MRDCRRMIGGTIPLFEEGRVMGRWCDVFDMQRFLGLEGANVYIVDVLFSLSSDVCLATRMPSTPTPPKRHSVSSDSLVKIEVELPRTCHRTCTPRIVGSSLITLVAPSPNFVAFSSPCTCSAVPTMRQSERLQLCVMLLQYTCSRHLLRGEQSQDTLPP